MIRNLHELRRHEEGQALVLACITMLVLAMCVLATINITYAAKERIELQNAADSTAYTTAAYEARALNFLAYTNRAMVVQYVAQMNLMAILSNFYFNTAVWEMLTEIVKIVTGALGPIGAVIGAIISVVQVVLTALAVIVLLGVAIAVPVIDGYNYATSLAQVAIINPKSPGAQYTLPWELSAAQGEGMDTLVKKINPSYVVNSLSQDLLNVDESNAGYTSRWGPGGTLVDVTQTPTQTPQITGEAAYDRLQMVEIINSGRSAWTAHGKDNWTVLLGFPRTGTLFSFDFLGIKGEAIKTSRTEYGALYNGNGTLGFFNQLVQGLFGNAGTPTDELFSLDRFLLSISIFGLSFNLALDSWAYADRSTPFTTIGSLLFGPTAMRSHNVVFESPLSATGGCGHNIFSPLYWLCLAAVGIVDGFLQALAAYMNTWLNGFLYTFSWLPLYSFGLWPYAKFRPAASTTGTGGVLSTPSAEGLFNQPPVLVMVTAPTTYLQQPGKPFMNIHTGDKWGVLMNQVHSSGSPNDAQPGVPSYAANRNTSFSKRAGGYVDLLSFNPGDPAPFNLTSVPAGFHAIASAMAYYHRPGDWREPPNLFNPQWGAKLMPLVDYPTLAQNTAIQPLFNNNLVVH